MYQRVIQMIVAALLLASCTTPTTPPATQEGVVIQSDGEVVLEATIVPDGVSSPQVYPKTSAAGRIVDPSGQPVANITVRFAEVFRNEADPSDGAYALNEAQSPSAITDAQGNFAFQNIDAREYVLVVGEVTDPSPVIADDSGKPRIWSPTADNPLEMGEISYNPPVAPSPSS